MQRILNNETINKIGEEVKVCGWVQTVRSHGKIVFFDLRDKSGIIQVVFVPGSNAYEKVKEVRSEWVVEITAKVNERPDKLKNASIETGNVELEAIEMNILNKAETLPFEIDKDTREISEEKRLKYRYLDLRSERMKNNLALRAKVIRHIRNFLCDRGFTEVETPVLTKSTPEGARDFLVPSRTMPGNFYALPQSPQQYKQLLMVAGLEKYFQIVRCFRDEDPRGDRQAEFTQLDIEMSFIDQEEILNLIEQLYVEIVKNVCPEKKILKTPFPRITYKEAMEKYGCDKPDLRENKDDPNELAFCFVTDFPMFEKSTGKGKYIAVHHPFTMPQEIDIEKIKKDPDNILAYQYDLALNGYEIGGGSIRTHNPKILEAVFEVLGHTKEEIQAQFGHLLEAFKYGVPPHGGIAPGIDRFIMILTNEANIREVMAFPKTGDNRDLMMDAPSSVSEEQLKELHLKINDEKK